LAQAPSQQQVDKITQQIAEFDQTLTNSVMLNGFKLDDQSNLDKNYRAIALQWNAEIKPLLLQSTDRHNSIVVLMQKITPFVNNIDYLVMAYQQDSENKIELLRIVQLVA
jgi:nitrate/nitrite-specific signal transduction histidine kinase